MGFASILWPGEPGETADERPPFFPDLSLDQVVEGILAGRAEYDLTPFFHTPLRDLEAIRYRQEVFRELENPALTGCVQRFAQGMRAVREHLAMSHKLYYKYQKAGYFLDAVELYCQAVRALWGNLVALQPAAAGWRGLQGYLAGYLRSQSFTSLEEEVQGLQQALGSVRYKMLIQGDRVTVLPYEAESNYGAEIEATFARFRQGVVKDYRVKFSDWAEMNHVEAQILDGVAYLYPALFERLLDFPRRYAGYPDRMVAAFDREVQFYLAYLEYLSGLRAARLPFCYPRVGKSKEVAVRGGFDLALAKRLASEGHAVVGNDFFLQGHERILVVSGPNQGGKTTFARMFGQVHYLASLGCAVPGEDHGLHADLARTRWPGAEPLLRAAWSQATELAKGRVRRPSSFGASPRSRSRSPAKGGIAQAEVPDVVAAVPTAGESREEAAVVPLRTPRL